ncbi:uncharacterized protein LOC114369388 isoform X3 [Glycine soja]|uniref:uncharacterized protein LOC114369388 isoform X3 n=1 Tax=Glycine soja TaxID=3848 RepID=UPI00103AB908|nr:uncharacterized protein LOC114369388 isoform X3 [Glycine soja]
MAEKKNPEQEEQHRFPVLTVLKNNAILKNIFIVLDEHDEDQTVLIGRHPNCNIVLTHPSVSRFHLRIRSNPSSRTLSLVDLASVQGTWVRGRKLEPGVSVELKEGDTFTVGISTRIYRLSWAPLTQLGVVVPQQHQKEDEQENIIKDENLEHTAEQDIPMSEDIVSVCCDEERKIHSEDEALGVPNGTETSCFPTNSCVENIICDCQLSPPYIQSPPCAQPVDELDNTKKIEARLEVEMPGETNLLCTLREYLKHNICLPVVEAVQGTKMQQFQAPHDTFTGQPPSLEMHWSSFQINIDPSSFDEKHAAAVPVIPTESEFGCTHGDNDKVEGILTTAPRSFNSENTCLIVDEDIPDSEFHKMEVVEEVSVDSVPDGEKQDEMHGSSSPTNLDPAFLDEKHVAAVAVIPTESEFGCTYGDNDKVEDILTTGSRTFNSENTCLIVDKDIPDSEFHQMEVVEEISVDSVPDEEKQDECDEENLNGKSCREEGYSLDEVVEDNGNKCIKNIDPASFDGKGLTAVSVIPTEFEFGCTLGDNERIEDILEMESRTINSENTSLLDEKAIAVTKFQLVNIVEEGGYSLDEVVEDNGNKCIKNIDPASFDGKGLAAVTVIPSESEFGCTLGDNERIEDILEMESRTINSENTSLLDENAIAVTKFQVVNIVEEVAMDSISDGEKQDKCGKELESKLPASLNAKSCHEQGKSVAEIAEDTGKKCASSISSTSFQVESPNSSMPREQTPQSLTAVTRCSGGEFLENHVKPTEKSSAFGSIWSRCKPASAPLVQARKSRFMSTAKVGTEVKRSNEKNVAINKLMPKDLSAVFDEEKEAFILNKENLSPNTYHLQFMRKRDKPEEIKHSISQRSPNLSYFSPRIYLDKRISSVSNKVNQTPKVAQEWKSQRKPLQCHINLVHEQDMMELKKNRVEKVAPFPSLMNSGGNHKSVTVSAAKSIDDVPICGQISNKCTKTSQHTSREQKRSWDMVVDTASLLNKESRKALQLLQGLKGTRLIIPSLVIRELGSMKQKFRIFRTTSEASLALEWIEECLEKTRWWIHIQSSMEEFRLTALTHHASPQTRFIEESWAFPGFTLKKCASPKVEDHILDSALQYGRKENVGQLVLLSSDVSLKIKSMAKGLLCETVQQFRQSLVNPFSERFMWPKSSPRGLTWSCQDDLVLREKYCGLPSKAGLKLITFHD